jgi:hypothetical protein
VRSDSGISNKVLRLKPKSPAIILVGNISTALLLSLTAALYVRLAADMLFLDLIQGSLKLQEVITCLEIGIFSKAILETAKQFIKFIINHHFIFRKIWGRGFSPQLGYFFEVPASCFIYSLTEETKIGMSQISF